MPVLLPGTRESLKLLARWKLQEERNAVAILSSFSFRRDPLKLEVIVGSLFIVRSQILPWLALRNLVKWCCAIAHLVKVGSHILVIDVLVHYLLTSKSNASAKEIRHYLF